MEQSSTREIILCDLFAEILHIESIAVHDDFFELGGYSELALQLVTRIRSEYHVELKLREFFSNPTVAGIAKLIARDE